MKWMPPVREAAILLPLLALLPVDDAWAESEFEIGYRHTYTDNIDLVEEDETSDVIRAPYVGFGWDKESSALTATLDGRFEYQDYREDTTADDTVGELSAVVDWRLIPERLSMRFEDRYEQVRFDSLDPLSPDNTEDANTFIVGPDLYFDPSPVDRLTFGARYGETTFERSTDSERFAYGSTWSHRLNSINEMLVHIERQEVTYTEVDENAVDYMIDEIALGWIHRLARGDLQLTVGGRRFDPDSGKTLERGFALLNWKYTPTRRTEFDFRAESGLTDAGGRLLDRNQPTVQLPSPDAFVSNDIVTLSQIQGRLLRRGALVDVTLGLRATEEDFNISNLDSESYGATFGIEYPLTPADRLEWTVGVAVTEYVLIDRTDDDLVSTLRLRHQFGRQLFGEVGIAYLERESTTAFSSYEENRAFLAAGYRWGN